MMRDIDAPLFPHITVPVPRSKEEKKDTGFTKKTLTYDAQKHFFRKQERVFLLAKVLFV